MSDPALSADLRRFIVARIPTVPMLEALLLLRLSPAGLPVSELAARLYVTEAHANGLAGALKRQGLAMRDGAVVRYAAGASQASLVDELAAVYAQRLVEVTNLIHSSPEQKAQRFADAFVLRREP